MSSNYNSFSPNCLLGQCGYADEMVLTAGDSQMELKVQLCNVPCDNVRPCTAQFLEDEPDEWEPLDISGYRYITAYVREICSGELLGTLPGSAVAPLTSGRTIYEFRDGFLDDVSGEYEMEIEVEFLDGRIVTALDKLKLNIRPDFSGHGAVVS